MYRKVLLVTAGLALLAFSNLSAAGRSSGGGTSSKVLGGAGAADVLYSGTVVSANAASKSFVVHLFTGSDITLKVSDRTQYLPNGRTWDDVRAGAVIEGKYHFDGTDKWADTVILQAPESPSKTGR
jgi:hypothetical protein